MTAPYGSRRVDITAMARARLTPDEKADIERVCRARGFLLSLMYVSTRRQYEARLTVGGKVYEGRSLTPYDAWRMALAQRDGPRIVSLLTPDNAA